MTDNDPRKTTRSVVDKAAPAIAITRNCSLISLREDIGISS